MSNLLDARCARIETGVKAVWFLYCDGDWTALQKLGFVRKQHEPIFEAFEDSVSGTSIMPLAARRIYRYEDIRRLIRYCPMVLDAAQRLTDQYYLLYCKARNTRTDCAGEKF